MLHTLEKGMLPLSVFMPHFPCPRHWNRDAARREISDFIMPIIKQRRARMAEGSETEESDFLWSVMSSTYPDGRPITDEEIVGFLVAAFFGGMHNSSITTAWTALEVMTRPDLARELLAEQKEVLGDGQFSYDAYKKMRKLRSVTMEVLRMHPPLMLLMRTVEADIKFQQYSIPRGSVVAVSPNVGNMLEEIYSEADTFKPFRFLESQPREYEFIPFGGGRRLCKGQEFGYLQVACCISHMLRAYECEALDGVTKPQYDMVVAPAQPCRLSFKRRGAKAPSAPGALSSPAELSQAKASGALVVDVRSADERSAGPTIAGSIHLPWEVEAMPLDGLPAKKNAQIIIHCAVGGRAGKAKAFLEERGYTDVLNGGGPRTPETWAAIQ